MRKEHPDHHDADLVLRVYEMRREAVMRQSRNTIMAEFWPKSFDDVKAVATRLDHPVNAAFRQVGTYWEMVYGMVKHGIVHPGYFLESNAEGFFLFARVHPFLEAYRKEISPLAFRNAEWVATECPEGKAVYEVIQARVKRMAEAREAAGR